MVDTTSKRSLVNIVFKGGEHFTINIRPNLTRKQVADMLRQLAFNIDKE